MRAEPQVSQERPAVRHVHHGPKKFRVEDRQLRGWLTHSGAPTDDDETFRETPVVLPGCGPNPFAVGAPGALDSANHLDEARWAFAAKERQEILQKRASGTDLGPFHNWQANHGLAFAANGRVEYRYSASTQTDRRATPSQWHLKAGDRTSPELAAARIYFTVAELDGKSLVLVAYVGPHPSDGKYKADFGDIEKI